MEGGDTQLYDYYYSAKYERIAIKQAQMENERHQVMKFKGKVFTECITSGKTPATKHDDNVLIGTGTKNDTSYE